MFIFPAPSPAAHGRRLADGGSTAVRLLMGDFIARREGFSLGICAEPQPDPGVGCFWEQRLVTGAAPLVAVLLPRGRDTAGQGPAHPP